MSIRTEWMEASRVSVEKGTYEDSYGSQGEGLIIWSGSSENLVIEGTEQEISALVGKMAALFPPRTWEVHTVYGLSEHDIEIFYTEEAAEAGFRATVERINKDFDITLLVDPEETGQWFATDWDDWEVRCL